jgi:hypothetical protein
MLQKLAFNANPAGLWSVVCAGDRSAGEADDATPPRPHDTTLFALRWWAEHLTSLSFAETPAYDDIEENLQDALRAERGEAQHAAAHAHALAQAHARAHAQALARVRLSFLVFTVTFYANHAHNSTCSP